MKDSTVFVKAARRVHKRYIGGIGACEALRDSSPSGHQARRLRLYMREHFSPTERSHLATYWWKQDFYEARGFGTYLGFTPTQQAERVIMLLLLAAMADAGDL